MQSNRLNHRSGSSVCASDYGAHVLSWQNARGNEWLFLSKNAHFAEGKSIRGGVPIIFPQFNERGPWQRHGFARVTTWQLRECSGSRLSFELRSNPHTRSLWPWEFQLGFDLDLTEMGLGMSLSVTNLDRESFEFTAALHTYFAIDALARTSLDGIEGFAFWDNDGQPFSLRSRADAERLEFKDAIDRVFFDVDRPLYLNDGGRRLQIAMQGFRDVVVWNPGQAAAATMSDMLPEEYRNMLCVEAAVIDRPIRLAPGECWVGTQTLNEQDLPA